MHINASNYFLFHEDYRMYMRTRRGSRNIAGDPYPGHFEFVSCGINNTQHDDNSEVKSTRNKNYFI